jgi:hypothetical protein
LATRYDLESWIIEALGGFPNQRGKIVDICRHVWAIHEQDLRSSDDLFFTWQYDIRWAANRLRDRKIMKPAEMSPKGVWELA